MVAFRTKEFVTLGEFVLPEFRDQQQQPVPVVPFRETQDTMMHHWQTDVAMVHPCVLGFSKRDDWDKLLLLIAKLWQDELTKSDEFLSFERDHGVISWDVVHHKRTILNVDGNPFVLARCNSDRLAVVARWKEESTGAQKELVHMYFAMGLPHQHSKQFIVLAVCKGLFVAAALVAAIRTWWSEILVLASTGDEQANQDLLKQWESLAPRGGPGVGLAASRERWQQTSVALERLREASEITGQTLSDVLSL